MSCMSPCAPFQDTAQGRAPDSSAMTARIRSGLIPSAAELSWTSLSNSAEGSGSQGGILKGTGVSTQGTVKKEAAGVGCLFITVATCWMTAVRCLAMEAAMADLIASGSGLGAF